MKYFILIVIALAFLSCKKDIEVPEQDRPYYLNIPQGFPEPVIPEDNQLTELRVKLGLQLFFDKKLSKDNTISCGSCHIPENAFTDNVSLSNGVEDRTGFRNAPSLINSAYLTELMRDGGVRSLEAQVLVPMQDHNEMDLKLEEAVLRLQDDENYNNLSEKGYGRSFDAFVLVRAIAAFERTLLMAGSKYDRYRNGDEKIFSDAEKKGFKIFEQNCMGCHSGFNLTDNGYQNNGIYNNYEDKGRARITLNPEDEGKFRVPSLRNIALTWPYMHDGSFSTLEEVIEHYNSGGKKHGNQSRLIKPLGLSEIQKAELKAFLETLTSDQFHEN